MLFTFLIPFALSAQPDTLIISYGELPESVFIEGYPFPESNGGFHVSDGTASLNLVQQNLQLFNSDDSTGHTGLVKLVDNEVRHYGQSHSAFDEYLFTFENGYRTFCEMKTFNRTFNRGGGKTRPWLAAINFVYFSDLGSNTDSLRYCTFNNQEQLLNESFIYSKNGKEIREETSYVNGEVAFQGKMEDDLLQGKWQWSVQTVSEKWTDTLITLECAFRNDTLIDVVSDNCLFLGRKDELLNKTRFFEQFPNLRNGHGDFIFLAMKEQAFSLSPNYPLILTANEDYFNGIPEKQLKRIRRRFRKQAGLKPAMN